MIANNRHGPIADHPPAEAAPAATQPVDRGATTEDAVRAAIQFWRMVRLRWRVVLACSLLALAIGGFYYFATDRVYQGQATILVLPSGSDVWDASMTTDTGRQALLPTYERLFSQDVVLRRAAARLVDLPPELRVDVDGVPRDKWVDVLRGGLTAKNVRRTNLIELRYRSRSRAAAAATVDLVVDAYLDFIEQNHKNVAADLVRILDQERGEVEQQLTRRQAQLLAAKREARDLGLGQQSAVLHPAVQRVVKMNEALVDIQQQRLQLDAALGAIRGSVQRGGDLRQHLLQIEPMVGRELLMAALGLNPQASQTLNDVQRRLIDDQAELESLSRHLGPNHPRVARLQRTVANARQYVAGYHGQVNQRLETVGSRQLARMLVSLVEDKLAKTWAHEIELARQYRSLESEAVRMNDKLAELAILENDLQRVRNLHDTLLNRIAGIDLHQNQADVRVALVGDPTAAEKPVSPRLSWVAMFVLAAGGVGGGAIVYILDLLDDRFRSPEELERQLDVPLLAMIRKLSPLSGNGLTAIHAAVAAETAETEAFRTLRTALALAAGDQPLQRLAVTSSEPSDGKTTVLANLAVCMAQSGKRTLLIDADLRRPGLTRLLDLRRLPGLADTVREESGEAAWTARIVPSGCAGLDVLPSGVKPPDPAELLGSRRFAELIAWAESQYDTVLIDCPPIVAASDAALVGRVADGMLLVVHPQKNPRRQVIRCVARLRAMQIPLVGVVANQIDSRGDAAYGYGSGYEYGYGYEHDDEDGDVGDGSESDSDDRVANETAAAAESRSDRSPTLEVTMRH